MNDNLYETSIQNALTLPLLSWRVKPFATLPLGTLGYPSWLLYKEKEKHFRFFKIQTIKMSLVWFVLTKKQQQIIKKSWKFNDSKILPAELLLGLLQSQQY